MKIITKLSFIYSGIPWVVNLVPSVENFSIGTNWYKFVPIGTNAWYQLVTTLGISL